jgi:hypothetical protein
MPTHDDGAVELVQGKIGETGIDLGDIYAGQRVSRTLIVRNGSEHRLSLDAEIECGCTHLQLEKPWLDPGASEKMIVTFDTSHVGEENALEHFVLFDKGQQTGGDRKPLLQATIKATVRPSIVLERGTIVWRFSPPGIDLPDQSVRIQNRTRQNKGSS